MRKKTLEMILWSAGTLGLFVQPVEAQSRIEMLRARLKALVNQSKTPRLKETINRGPGVYSPSETGLLVKGKPAYAVVLDDVDNLVINLLGDKPNLEYYHMPLVGKNLENKRVQNINQTTLLEGYLSGASEFLWDDILDSAPDKLSKAVLNLMEEKGKYLQKDILESKSKAFDYMEGSGVGHSFVVNESGDPQKRIILIDADDFVLSYIKDGRKEFLKSNGKKHSQDIDNWFSTFVSESIGSKLEKQEYTRRKILDKRIGYDEKSAEISRKKREYYDFQQTLLEMSLHQPFIDQPGYHRTYSASDVRRAWKDMINEWKSNQISIDKSNGRHFFKMLKNVSNEVAYLSKNSSYEDYKKVFDLIVLNRMVWSIFPGLNIDNYNLSNSTIPKNSTFYKDGDNIAITLGNKPGFDYYWENGKFLEYKISERNPVKRQDTLGDWIYIDSNFWVDTNGTKHFPRPGDFIGTDGAYQFLGTGRYRAFGGPTVMIRSGMGRANNNRYPTEYNQFMR